MSEKARSRATGSSKPVTPKAPPPPLEEPEECDDEVCVAAPPTLPAPKSAPSTTKAPASTPSTTKAPASTKPATKPPVKEPATTTATTTTIATKPKGGSKGTVVAAVREQVAPPAPPPEAAPDVAEDEEEEEEPEDEKCRPLLFEMHTSEGKNLRILFDMVYNLMNTDLYLIITRSGLLYSASDNQGQIVMQFQLMADKLTRYNPPWNLHNKDDCLVVSTSSQNMQAATKANNKDTSTNICIEKRNKSTFKITVVANNSSPTYNTVRLGGDKGYQPVDVPQFPADLRPIVKVGGKEFSEKWKSLAPFGDETELVVQREGVSAYAGSPETKSSKPVFGVLQEKAPELFRGTFSSAMMTNIAKCGAMTKQVLIYCVPGKPLKIMADIGSIGSLYIHLYSKK
jgi:hypothetical protein